MLRSFRSLSGVMAAAMLTTPQMFLIVQNALQHQTAQASQAQVQRMQPKAALAVSNSFSNSSSSTDYPVRIIAPAIGLDSPIVSVGINNRGEMDVPDGSTDKVGWYKKGTVPGFAGNAVLDAHVYAAFQELRYLKVGGDIFVITASGKKLHFVVTDSRVYALGEITPKMLFGRTSEQRLNLITCAGKPSKDGSTYDHRLVVYSTFVGEVS